MKACLAAGMESSIFELPADSTQEQVKEVITGLNNDPKVHGILVQHPVPKHLDENDILGHVAVAKDVDGISVYSLGKLLLGEAKFVACTPLGIVELMNRYDIPIKGKRAVVVGRSDIVGKPIALLLLHEHATVTICHSKTPNLSGVCREADILVAAIGRPAMINAEYIRPGATVVDVGMNRLDSRDDVARIFRNSQAKLAAFDKRGSVLVGDVDPIDMAEISSAYTPVPGGVGLVTIAMLMANTVASAERRAAGC
jgi:methylenetetrahydrofolate dehydrogenase (NADP+)/methenyltetrahydrofolate cyclohydrolase